MVLKLILDTGATKSLIDVTTLRSLGFDPGQSGKTVTVLTGSSEPTKGSGIMSHNDFTHLLDSIATLSPEQIQLLYRELESKMTTPPAVAQPAASEQAAAPARKPIWERILEI